MAATPTRERLKRGDRAEILARRHWCELILETPPRSSDRTQAIQQAAAALGLAKSAVYTFLAQYRQLVEQPAAATVVDPLERRRRADAGRDRAPAGLRETWEGFASDPRRADQTVAQRYCDFRAIWEASHPGGERFPACCTLERWLRELDPALPKTKRERRFKHQRRIRLLADGPNHVWEADQRQADFFVVDRRVDRSTGEIQERKYRPLLFTFLDMDSQAIMGARYYEGAHTSYGTDLVEATLRLAMRPTSPELPFCGVPRVIYWDNAKAHKSHWMREIASLLGIGLEFSLPRDSQAHGLIEGFHHLIKDGLESGLPGFLGGDNRKDTRTLQMRLVDEGELAEPEYLTLEEANRELADWQIRFHGQALNNGPSRLQRWLTITPERRRYPRDEDLGWRFLKWRQVTVHGGEFRLFNVPYTGPHLADWHGQRLRAYYLEADVQQVWVAYEGQLQCIATPREGFLYGAGAGFAQVREHKREFAQFEARLGESRTALSAAVQTNLLEAAEAAGADEALRKLGKPLPERKRAALRRQMDAMSGRPLVPAATRPDNVVPLIPRPEPFEIQTPTRPADAVPYLSDSDTTAPERRAVNAEDYL